MSKKLIMAAAAAADKDNDTLQLPLRTWMDIETKTLFSHKESIVRKTTIAYGILELLLRCFKSTSTDNNSMPTFKNKDEDDVIHTDNFTVLISSRNSSQPSWDDITGVTMNSPKLLSLTIEEPAYLTCLFEPDETHGQLGRYLEVEHHDHDVSSSLVVQKEEHSTTAVLPTNAEAAMTTADDLRTNDNNNERVRVNNNKCYYLVAKVLYELFANEAFPEESSSLSTVNEAATTTTIASTNVTTTVSSEEPAQKKLKSSSSSHHRKLLSQPPTTKGDFFNEAKQLPFQIPSIVRMQQQLGIPASLCRMMQNLLEAASLSRGDNDDDDDDDNQSFNDAYKSLREVAEDLHLLLLDPDRFLFDNE
eukprot:scaffold2263_cov76-Skeletonema_dohrnii-CCMP3373.AAC.7